MQTVGCLITVNEVILLSFVTGSIAFTVAETKLFRPIRKWAEEKNGFIGKLLSCGYCFGHWVAFALLAIYRPRLFHAWLPLDYLLTAIVIAWLGALQWILMCWLMAKAGK